MNTKKVADRSFGPIIQLDEGETVLLTVTDVREGVGPYKSSLVGCVTLDGTEVTLTGHAILVDKIERAERVLPSPFLVTRAKLIGDAINYDVEAVLDTAETLVKDKAVKSIMASTKRIVDAHIDALPPRE